jgi:hypothetical protein
VPKAGHLRHRHTLHSSALRLQCRQPDDALGCAFVAKTAADTPLSAETVQYCTQNKTVMKIKPGFELRMMCGENVIIAYGEENINFSKIIALNESATVIWNAVIGKEFTVEDMAKALCEEYEVDPQEALKDSEKIAKEWQELGLC